MDLEFVDHLKSFLKDQGYDLTFIAAKLDGNLFTEQFMVIEVKRFYTKEEIARIKEKEDD